MLCGLLLMAASSMLGTAATGLTWLLALRALEGLGLLLAAMPAPGLIRRHVRPSDLSARMGWWAAYMPLGSALGLLLGPWVLQVASWQLWWGLLGVVSSLAALAVWRWVPADPPLPSTLRQHDAGWRPRLALTLRSPGPWLVALTFMVYSGQWMGVIGFLPTIYANAGLDAKLAGVLTALVAGANTVGNVVSGKLLQGGWSARRCLQTGFAVMGLCALLAYVQVQGQPLAPLWLRFVAVLFFSAAGGLIPSGLFTSVLHLAPSRDTVSTTVGFMQQWSCAGQFAGPPLVATVATLMGGWHWIWVVTACMCSIGWLLAMGVQKHWRPATAG